MFNKSKMSFEEAKEKKSWLSNDFLTDISDAEYHKLLQNSLMKTKPHERLKPIAEKLGYDESDFCIVSRRISSMYPKKDIPVICTVSTFNDEFNDVIRSTGESKFAPTYKAWKIKDNEKNQNIIKDYIFSHYSFIIDYESMKIFKNENKIISSKNQEAFYTLPYHKKVDIEEIMNSIGIVREDDVEDMTSLYLYDGKQFMNSNGFHKVFWTQSPFLLFRYGVQSGQPRYVVYSTIGKFVEKVIFQSSGRRLKETIALFRDKARENKDVYVKPKRAKTIMENKKTIGKLRKEFTEYKDDEKNINSFFTDFYGFPLSTGYIDSDVYIGNRKNILAYAITNSPNHMQISKNIAKYFGYHDKRKNLFPVVFNANLIDTFEDNEDFQHVMIHEIAHYVAAIGQRDFFGDSDISYNFPNGGHNLAWVIGTIIIDSLMEGDFLPTDGRYYYYKILENRTIGDLYEEIDLVSEKLYDEIVDEGHEDTPFDLEYLCSKIKKGLEEMKKMIKLD